VTIQLQSFESLPSKCKDSTWWPNCYHSLKAWHTLIKHYQWSTGLWRGLLGSLITADSQHDTIWISTLNSSQLDCSGSMGEGLGKMLTCSVQIPVVAKQQVATSLGLGLPPHETLGLRLWTLDHCLCLCPPTLALMNMKLLGWGWL